MKYLPFILIMLGCLQVSAQSDQTGKWKVSAGGGMAVPLTKYGSVDVQNSISRNWNDELVVFEFFDKENHGAAQLGYFLTASVARQMFRHFLVSLNFDYTQNSVSTSEMNAYYDETMNDYYDGTVFANYLHVFSQDAYQIKSTYLGIGYTISKNNWNMAFQPLVGHATMAFPIYDLEVDISTGLMRFKHRGATPDSQSFTYGISVAMGVSLFRNVFVEMNSKYLSADFDYVIEPHIVGSSDSRIRSDVVNYRIFDLGVSIGVAF